MGTRKDSEKSNKDDQSMEQLLYKEQLSKLGFFSLGKKKRQFIKGYGRGCKITGSINSAGLLTKELRPGGAKTKTSKILQTAAKFSVNLLTMGCCQCKNLTLVQVEPGLVL